MLTVTIRILDGAGRGRIYQSLETPVTIGREEGNSIQLNDDRVSRYHLKIQEDHDKLVLTDLESTNGTKVNGEDIQLRILRHGDLITVGRSVLLIGSRAEIADRLADLRDNGDVAQTRRDEQQYGTGEAGDVSENLDRLAEELGWDDVSELPATLHALAAPDLPDNLTPGQAAQLSELLEYLHIRIRRILANATPAADGPAADGNEKMIVTLRPWQDVVDLQAHLADYLRRIGEP